MTKNALKKQLLAYEYQMEEMEDEMVEACSHISDLKEEIAYLRGVIDGRPGGSSGRGESPDVTSDKGVLKLNGFSVAVGPDMAVKDVDEMAHACQDQMDWADENDIIISEGGNADKN